jgi:hypothetical protein
VFAAFEASGGLWRGLIKELEESGAHVEHVEHVYGFV